MTSPATYRCTACGAELSRVRALDPTSGGDVFVLHHPGICPGVTLELFRDDRAGVTMPTALEPVGGDELDAGGAGKVESNGDAVAGGHVDNMRPGSAPRDVNRTPAGGPAGSRTFTVEVSRG